MVRRVLAWMLVVGLGLASLGSGFLGALSHMAQERPAVADLRLSLLHLRLGDLPLWPWYVLTPLLMTATFLAIQHAHGADE